MLKNKKNAKVVTVVNTLNVKRRDERTAYAVGMMEKHKEFELDMKEERKEYEVDMKEKQHELEMVIIEAELESSKVLANHLEIKEAKILAERQGKELLQRERMFWAEKVARYERTCLKELEREKKIMIHNHAKDVNNNEKDTEHLNTRLSAMESNFDKERAKYHNNLNKVKASVQPEIHKVHQKKILRRELVESECSGRRRLQDMRERV